MSYKCDKCGKEFEQPKIVESGGEYSGIAHKYPASPCCESDFEETIHDYFNEGTPFKSMASQPVLGDSGCYECKHFDNCGIRMDYGNDGCDEKEV